MAKARKIKIYTHHRQYFKTGAGAIKKISGLPKKFASWVFYFFYSIGYSVSKFFGFLKKSVFAVCFHTGNALFISALKTFRGAKNDIIKTRDNFPKRVSLLFSPQFNKALLSFLFIACLGWGGLASLNLAAKALDIKGKIMRTALVGDIYLSQAKDALSSQNLTQAQDSFNQAYQTFTNGQQDIQNSGQLLNGLLNLIPQKADADRLISAAALISGAGQDFIALASDVKNLKITSSGIVSSGRPTAEVFQNITGDLNTIQTKLESAAEDVNSVDPNNLPAENRVTFLSLKDELNASLSALNNFNQIFTLSGSLLIGQKNILLLFENNNELRASGGFMGTYGAVALNDGTITKIKVSSIYDLDGQLTDNIQPPIPLLNLTDRWALRDSNWFADFPTSAKKITEFYEREGGETPDIIVAITPNIIIDWLKMTGPITLPQYGLTLTSDNFIEETQVATTLSNNLPVNAPKQILADLVPVLLQKISALGNGSLPAIIQSLQDNLNNKQIVIFSRDPDTESQLQAFNWAGQLQQTDRDYVSVVSSNLGGTKTDLYVDQQLNLTTSVASDGTITDELDITRTNKMPELDQTNNLSFLRVYVPLGSKLISNIGFDFKNLDSLENPSYSVDGDVYNWEKNSVKDVLTGTTIGQESGKTFFGNWLNVNGGETKTVKLVYQLPFKLNDIDRYSLILQKQIGAQNQNVNWTFNFPDYQIAWKNFDPDQLNTDNLNSAIILDKDYFFGMVLQKR